jgi:hypothetical protein
MRLAIPAAIVALALPLAAGAQNSKTKSRTEIKADDARVMSMTGCLRQGAANGVFMLDGAVAASGKELQTESKIKTDVDKDQTKVTGKTETKAKDGAVATSGTSSTFLLVPGNNVDLASHVGEQVQVAAIMVERGHGDADVTIKDKTTVDPEHGKDSTATTKTKLELPKSPAGQYTVMSLTSTGMRCEQ